MRGGATQGRVAQTAAAPETARDPPRVYGDYMLSLPTAWQPLAHLSPREAARRTQFGAFMLGGTREVAVVGVQESRTEKIREEVKRKHPEESKAMLDALVFAEERKLEMREQEEQRRLAERLREQKRRQDQRKLDSIKLPRFVDSGGNEVPIGATSSRAWMVEHCPDVYHKFGTMLREAQRAQQMENVKRSDLAFERKQRKTAKDAMSREQRREASVRRQRAEQERELVARAAKERRHLQDVQTECARRAATQHEALVDAVAHREVDAEQRLAALREEQTAKMRERELKFAQTRDDIVKAQDREQRRRDRAAQRSQAKWAAASERGVLAKSAILGAESARSAQRREAMADATERARAHAAQLQQDRREATIQRLAEKNDAAERAAEKRDRDHFAFVRRTEQRLAKAEAQYLDSLDHTARRRRERIQQVEHAVYTARLRRIETIAAAAAQHEQAHTAREARVARRRDRMDRRSAGQVVDSSSSSYGAYDTDAGNDECHQVSALNGHPDVDRHVSLPGLIVQPPKKAPEQGPSPRTWPLAQRAGSAAASRAPSAVPSSQRRDDSDSPRRANAGNHGRLHAATRSTDFQSVVEAAMARQHASEARRAEQEKRRVAELAEKEKKWRATRVAGMEQFERKQEARERRNAALMERPSPREYASPKSLERWEAKVKALSTGEVHAPRGNSPREQSQTRKQRTASPQRPTARLGTGPDATIKSTRLSSPAGGLDGNGTLGSEPTGVPASQQQLQSDLRKEAIVDRKKQLAAERARRVEVAEARRVEQTAAASSSHAKRNRKRLAEHQSRADAARDEARRRYQARLQEQEAAVEASALRRDDFLHERRRVAAAQSAKLQETALRRQRLDADAARRADELKERELRSKQKFTAIYDPSVPEDLTTNTAAPSDDVSTIRSPISRPETANFNATVTSRERSPP